MSPGSRLKSKHQVSSRRRFVAVEHIEKKFKYWGLYIMRRGSLETAVGALVIVIAVIFAIFTYKVTDYGRKTGYLLFAEFNHVGSIKTG